jgi:hypothetical protein
MQGTSKHDPTTNPKTIRWRGLTLHKWYTTSRTSAYHWGDALLGDPLRVELKQLGADNFTATLSTYRLSTCEQGHCDNLDEVRALLDRCLDGLHGLLQDGLKAVDELKARGGSNGT